MYVTEGTKRSVLKIRKNFCARNTVVKSLGSLKVTNLLIALLILSNVKIVISIIRLIKLSIRME